MVQGQLPSRYRVIEEVGQGGMAVVYRAHDESLKRDVAVKLLHPHLLAEVESKTRLEREARAVATLHHDNIVQIFDYSGVDAASSYIVTEFIDGQTLKQFMANRRPPPPEVAALVAIEIGNALLHAHSLGIIHRDVKPDNVMVRKDGMLKLMDFGVAQIMDLERMTVTGQLLGSPAYMAPELLEGRPLDVRTDVFSVGIMLYQLATGALPFSGRNPHEVLKRIAEGKFADPRTINRLVADRLAKIIARALARRPEDRYATVAALVNDLGGFVVDAGLGLPRDELRLYFSKPEDYEKEVVPRMIEALVAGGKREREHKHTARALELWNRALGMEPGNREVLGELKSAAGRQHLQRAAVAVGSAALLAAGVYFVLRQAAGDPATAEAPQANPPLTARTEAAPPATRVLPAAIPPLPTTTGALTQPPGPHRQRPAARPGPRAAARGLTQKRVFQLVPLSVKAAHIYLDGASHGFFGPQNDRIEVDLSENHVLSLRNEECCEEEVRQLGPDHDLPEDGRILFSLKGKPGRITVKTRPETAKGRVGVRELDPDPGNANPTNTAGALGSAIMVSFHGDTDMKKQLLLTISIEGRLPENHQVELRAGARETKEVILTN